jgi:hypothetical protein
MRACILFFAFTSEDEDSFDAGSAVVVLAPVNDFGPPGALIGRT